MANETILGLLQINEQESKRRQGNTNFLEFFPTQPINIMKKPLPQKKSPSSSAPPSDDKKNPSTSLSGIVKSNSPEKTNSFIPVVSLTSSGLARSLAEYSPKLPTQEKVESLEEEVSPKSKKSKAEKAEKKLQKRIFEKGECTAPDAKIYRHYLPKFSA